MPLSWMFHAGRQVVVTTDLLIEGIHFRRDWSDPYSIGWKAAAVNLSDLAAMGADPTFAFVSLALHAGGHRGKSGTAL